MIEATEEHHSSMREATAKAIVTSVEVPQVEVVGGTE